MRIVVEAWAAAEVPAGRGRYVRELLSALDEAGSSHEIVLLGRERWDDTPARMSWVSLPGHGPAWIARAARTARRRGDVLLATTSYALPVLARMPAAAVVYDLVAFDRALSPTRGALLERLTLPPAVRACGALLCISEATRAELVARFPRAAGRAVVTPLAADPRFAQARDDGGVAERHGVRRPFVLSAATLEPRKNLPRLIEAFAGLEADLREAFELVLVGQRGWDSTSLDASVARHRDLVRALGRVSDEDLAALYAEATAVAYVSLAEGFGLPVLEAMAAGTPVLTADRSSMPEVGGDAAAYADPTDVDAIRTQLDALLRDPARRAELAARGRARAAEFSWARCAEQTVAALARVAGEDPHVAP